MHRICEATDVHFLGKSGTFDLQKCHFCLAALVQKSDKMAPPERNTLEDKKIRKVSPARDILLEKIFSPRISKSGVG